jgi:hypothetical protein
MPIATVFLVLLAVLLLLYLFDEETRNFFRLLPGHMPHLARSMSINAQQASLVIRGIRNPDYSREEFANAKTIVIFIHGLNANLIKWRDIMLRIESKHGRSIPSFAVRVKRGGKVKAQVAVDSILRQLAFLGDTSDKRVLLVGESNGGRLAVLLADYFEDPYICCIAGALGGSELVNAIGKWSTIFSGKHLAMEMKPSSVVTAGVMEKAHTLADQGRIVCYYNENDTHIIPATHSIVPGKGVERHVENVTHVTMTQDIEDEICEFIDEFCQE